VPGARPIGVLSAALALLLPAGAAAGVDVRAAFHGSKRWVDFSSAGVIVRELWLPVEGTPLTLVHAVRTSPAVPAFEGELFAVVSATGAPWEGALSTDACPPLETVRTMTVLYRQGGGVVVRIGQGDAARRPFETCADLYATADLGACTVRVPIKEDAEEILSAPDQTKVGNAWLAAGRGRVDVPRSPQAGLKLTTALRECIGEDETPRIAAVDDRLALAGSQRMLLVSEALTAVCLPCDEEVKRVVPSPLAADVVAKKHRAASNAWRSGRREDALLQWRQLYETWWSGSRDPAPVWVDVLEKFGAALAAHKQHDQARQVFEEAWAMTKTPPESLLVSMGDVYRELGDVDAAKAAYERALAGAPSREQRVHAANQLAKLRK
jgi:hypothetical protein